MLSTLRSVFLTAPVLLFLTFVMGTLSFVASFLDKTGRMQHRMARDWSRMLLFVSGVEVTVSGLDNLDPTLSYVLTANHSSYMDTPIILASLPLQFRFLAKKSLFYWPMVGTHLKRAGHIPVVRDDPRGSVKTMSEAARIIREKQVSVLVFPEGGRTRDGDLQEFKEGAAFIALKGGIPVLPVAIKGARPILPMGSVLVRGGKVKLMIGSPIQTGSLTTKDRGALSLHIRARIVQLLDGTSVEAETAKHGA